MATAGMITLARRGLEALHALRKGAPFTGEDRAILTDWPGWGVFAPAFSVDAEGSWAKIADDLAEVCTDAQWHAATETLDTSFYTPPSIVKLTWDVLSSAGFTGGTVLDLGCGTGQYLAGAPDDTQISYVGVDADPTAAKIAQILHPAATIHCAKAQELALPRGFDVVVGNVPFSQASVYDRALGIHAPLHEYCIRRGLAQLRDGGYLAVITSRFSVDGKDSVTSYAGSDFVGAVRLPAGTFPGTQVVADLVVLRKRDTHYRSGWIPSDEQPAGADMFDHMERTKVARYWLEKPGHIAGRMKETGNWRSPVTVVSDDPARDIYKAMRGLLGDVERCPMRAQTGGYDAHGTADTSGTSSGELLSEGRFVLDGDEVRQVRDGEPAALARRASKELLALVALRDAGEALIAAEGQADATDAELKPLRLQARSLYESYVAAFGPLNRGTLHEGALDAETGAPSLSWRRPALGGFRADPSCPLVLALEEYDAATGEAAPAAILLRRVNRPPVRVTSAATPAEALSVCLGERGRVDLAHIAGLLGLDGEAEAADALGDLVYRDPSVRGSASWLPARSYLCGHVPAKIEVARRRAAIEPEFSRNVEALEAVMPAPLTASDITVLIGNPCVEPGDVSDFMHELAGIRPNYSYDPLSASWECSSFGQASPGAKSRWGVPNLGPEQIVLAALNGKAPIVHESEHGPKSAKTRDAAQTSAAVAKLAEIQERFSVWVWEDKARAQRILAAYNARFNGFVPRTNDGSHLRLDGLSEAFTPHPWQLGFVDMAVSMPAALCGHTMGAGKTRTMAMLAVALRQFGLAQKPLIVVPNHLLEDVARELQQTFPVHSFLVASEGDLAKDARRRFVARCATGDWTAVIMTHSVFSSLSVDPKVEADWVEDQVWRLKDHLRGGSHVTSKAVARLIRSAEARLAKLRDDSRHDRDQVIFDHLGVDYLMIDEAHMMKRLDIASRTEGFSMGSSKRATDLLLKMSVLRGRRPGKPVASFFTGTPWTNSLAESWVWLRFLAPDMLDDLGLTHFDAFASVFVRRDAVVEVAPDGGGFRLAVRPRIENAQDMKAMLATVADVMSPEDLGLDIPARQVHSISVRPSPEQSAYVSTLVGRARAIRERKNSATSTDCMLSVCTDGRRVALDPALMGVGGPAPKIERVAEEVARLYREHAGDVFGGSPVAGALQVVFCDMGVPGADRGSQSYGRLRNHLVALGVPAESIRFVHEAKDDKARAVLYAACRNGGVSVLVGSTEKLGTGTNIQNRLMAVHHMDAPWRPSDVEQREGRALRPHNTYESVGVYRYVTERTFDAYMWQTLESKAAAFAVFYRKDAGDRSLADVGEIVPDYAEMKALASGSPLLAEQARLGHEVKRLRMLRAVDRQSVASMRDDERRLKFAVSHVESTLKALSDYVDSPAFGDTDDAASAGVEMARALRNRRASYGGYHLGSWRGLGLDFKKSSSEFVAQVKYRDVHTLRLSTSERKTVMRGSVVKAGAVIAEHLEAFWGSIPVLVEGAGENVARLRGQLESLQEAIASHVFSEDGALRAAELRLAEIASLIAAEADKGDDAEGEVVERAA